MSINMDRSRNIENERQLAGHMQAEKKNYNNYWMSDGIANDVRWGVTAWGGQNMTRICEANLPWFEAHFKREIELGLMTINLRESYPGSGDGYIFIEAAICRYDDTVRKSLAIKLYDWLAEMDDYPYADGTGTHVVIDGRTYHDASDYENDLNWNEAERIIREEYDFKGFVSDDAPDGWIGKVMSWLIENHPEELDSDGGQGPYPTPERVLEAMFEVCPEALSDDYATNEMVIERRQARGFGGRIENPMYYVVPLGLRGGNGIRRNWLHLEYSSSQGELDAWLACYAWIQRYGFVWTTGQAIEA